MNIVTSELIRIKTFWATIGIFDTSPIKLLCDNQAVLYIAKKLVFHERTKHIEPNCHFLQERILSGKLITCNVSFKDQLADIFTKALGKQ